MMRFSCVLHENTLYYMKIRCISVKKSVVQIEHFFRKKRRYLLYFYAILMPIYQHHRNARMMRFTCVLHENTMYFSEKKCCSN